MTNQEEIMDGIIKWFLMRNPDKSRSWAEYETKALFIKEDELGVVVKVESELPDCDGRPCPLTDRVVVEPLIREEK